MSRNIVRTLQSSRIGQSLLLRHETYFRSSSVSFPTTFVDDSKCGGGGEDDDDDKDDDDVFSPCWKTLYFLYSVTPWKCASETNQDKWYQHTPFKPASSHDNQITADRTDL
jgi:hypothetical protein